MRISNTCMKKCDTKMTYQKAIDVLKMENDLMQFNPMTGDIVTIGFYNKNDKELYEANLLAIDALEKQANELLAIEELEKHMKEKERKL